MIAPPSEVGEAPFPAGTDPTGPTGVATDPPANTDPPSVGAVDNSRGGGFLRELPVLFVVAAVIAFLLKSLVAQAFYIPSGSMIPQLQINDRVVVSKISFRLHEPRRGDLIVFDAPTEEFSPAPTASGSGVARAVQVFGEAVGLVQPSTEEFIKRVIGLPGETVEGRDGQVYINGRLLNEPYMPDGVTTSDFAPVEVPQGRLWVMGDNRGNSADSRFFGTIERDRVVGRAVLKVWPPTSASFL